MLVRNRSIPNQLVTVFDNNGFKLSRFESTKQANLHLGIPENKERVVFTLKGTVRVNGRVMEERDVAYIPLGEQLDLEMNSGSLTFIVETYATEKYASYFKKYLEAPRTSSGQDSFQRTIVVSIGLQDNANGFIVGFVEGNPGQWTSYPPHRHDEKSEAYVYFNVDPGFAVQLEIDDEEPRAHVVHDYDTFLVTKGYHPHVNTSLTAGGYVWIMSTEPGKRNLDIMVHPSYKSVNVGKSHLSSK